jgi:methyl-accepting chemotaxis protein
VQQADAGTALVHQAGTTMKEIVESIKQVTQMMADIVVARAGQTEGLSLVNVVISEMNSVTQQNAALLEQAAAGAQLLQDQAGHMEGVVGVFRLDGMPSHLLGQVTQSGPTLNFWLRFCPVLS